MEHSCRPGLAERSRAIVSDVAGSGAFLNCFLQTIDMQYSTANRKSSMSRKMYSGTGRLAFLRLRYEAESNTCSMLQECNSCVSV